jgi:hypothetical protein
MNKRKQVEHSLQETKERLCSDCDDRDCKYCKFNKSAKEILNDAGDEKYHLLADEGII